MKVVLTRIGMGLLAFAVLGFAGLNVLARNHARSMMTYAADGPRTGKPEVLTPWQRLAVLVVGVNLPRPQGGATPADAGLDYRALTIPGPGGIRLGAWHCPAADSDTLAILFHGYGASKSDMLAEAAGFHELGVSVLLVDFRGSGASSESYTTIGYREAEDVAAAVAFAGREFAYTRHVLFGQSMGAAAILRAIETEGVRPDAVVIEAVFDSLLSTVRNRFHSMRVPSFPSAELLLFWGGRRVGFDPFGHNPVDYARGVTCPILFMHGANDPRARIEEARRVFGAVPAPKRFKEFPEAGHESYAGRFPGEWKQAVAALFKEAGVS
jgi:pimeloyl-ACP methyl ester carboxylesterase